MPYAATRLPPLATWTRSAERRGGQKSLGARDVPARWLAHSRNAEPPRPPLGLARLSLLILVTVQ